MKSFFLLSIRNHLIENGLSYLKVNIRSHYLKFEKMGNSKKVIKRILMDLFGPDFVLFTKTPINDGKFLLIGWIPFVNKSDSDRIEIDMKIKETEDCVLFRVENNNILNSYTFKLIVKFLFMAFKKQPIAMKEIPSEENNWKAMKFILFNTQKVEAEENLKKEEEVKQ